MQVVCGGKEASCFFFGIVSCVQVVCKEEGGGKTEDDGAASYK